MCADCVISVGKKWNAGQKCSKKSTQSAHPSPILHPPKSSPYIDTAKKELIFIHQFMYLIGNGRRDKHAGKGRRGLKLDHFIVETQIGIRRQFTAHKDLCMYVFWNNK